MFKWETIFDPAFALEALPDILEGLPLTLALSLSGFLLGIVGGFFLALMKMSPLAIFRWPAHIYTALMRGIPLMVLLVFIHFALPPAGITMTPVMSTVVAFALMSSAYISEIIRSSLDAVDIGQWEAARSLGIRPVSMYRSIIIPQALRIAVPPLGNVMMDMIKSSSLAATISVPEIFNQAKKVGGAEPDYMTAFILVGMIYCVICGVFALVQFLLEWKLNRGWKEKRV